MTGEKAGYYRDYGDTHHVERTLTEGFAYQGEASAHRKGQRRGETSSHLPPTAFVNFIQNHDQIGNRPLGERLTTLCAAEPLAAALAVLLLQPSPPLLFMGEEWGATEPFPFFCDFKGDLATPYATDARRNSLKLTRSTATKFQTPCRPTHVQARCSTGMPRADPRMPNGSL